MADSAVRRLNQDPYDEHTVDLIRHLFLPKDGQDPNDRGKMSKVLRIFDNIIEYYRTETTGPLDQHDIIIYCDDSRYEDRGRRDSLRRKLYYDTCKPDDVTTGPIPSLLVLINLSHIATNTHVLYKKKTCHDGLMETVALAVTYNAQWESEEWDEEQREVVYNYEDRPTQIQICPWFIDWIKNKEYKLSNDVKRSNIGRYIIKKVEGNQWFRQIDAFSLLDKVLLHEMTHGRSVWEEQKFINNEWENFEGTLDVTVPGTTLVPFLPFFSTPRPAYGWKWAGDLARKGPDTTGLHGWDPKAPDHNADSIALFGSACKLLDDPDKPRRVLDDGRIAIIPRRQ
ncbi:hypothetical protein JI435_132000 [Parastagonospora nodorum SN15]|uniref:Lysine-specific metallo-endopeptidase domain-containing protein n=1 Tax=Phaeosphaeria nodorum (strain SN15 / ATCC MYA-4574 / FGSC 10173) TaxID=321614 RepID=A0A7U2ICN7_PHANO|nr:hypothetical protein JI435_132000 [Parastagonospora nodorum SN15]